MPLKCDLLCEALQFPEEEDASCSVLPWHLLYHSTGNTCVVCIAQLVTTQAHWRGHDLLSDALCYVGPLTEKHSLSVLFMNSVAVKSFLTWPWSCFPGMASTTDVSFPETTENTANSCSQNRLSNQKNDTGSFWVFLLQENWDWFLPLSLTHHHLKSLPSWLCCFWTHCRIYML